LEANIVGETVGDIVPSHYHFYVTEITYLPVREDPKASETPN